jgi:hypothetical protein
MPKIDEYIAGLSASPLAPWAGSTPGQLTAQSRRGPRAQFGRRHAQACRPNALLVEHDLHRIAFAKGAEMNKPFTVVAVLVLLLVSLLQLIRLVLGWAITIDGTAIPLWASGVAFVAAAALAAMVWRELHS